MADDMQTIQDPSGGLHQFPRSMPDDQIHAEMTKRWNAARQPAQMPLTPPVQPPGTRPGGMQPQSAAPDASMAPLSEDAERYMRMLQLKAMQGDRAGVMGAENLLKAEPTYVHRQEQAKKMGDDAATLAAKQGAGTRVYSAVDELEQKAQAWLEHLPSAFNAAIGPYNSDPRLQRWTGTLPVIGNSAGYDFHTLMDHDIHKLTALYREMPSSGRGAGSDAQDANFMEAMGAARKAQTPEAFFAIMQSAKQLVRDKAGLPHNFDLPRAPLHPTDVAVINRYATAKPIRPGSKYQPVPVKTPQEAEALKPGTYYLTPDHKMMKR